MSAGRYPYQQALATAGLFIANVQHVCQRIEIAGSLRRLLSAGAPAPDATVGDIELLAIPLRVGPRNLLWERTERTYRLWEGIDVNGRRYVRSGPRYRKLAGRAPDGQHLPVDLYTAEEGTWGYQFVLRTGPAEWNKALVTSVEQGGLLPPDMRLHEGHVYLDKWECLVHSEEAFFRLLGLPYLPPHERDVARLRDRELSQPPVRRRAQALVVQGG